MERSPVYSAGPQPPTAATGGDGVAVLENPAYSLPLYPQTVPGTQAPTATTVGGDGQEKKNEEREPDDWQCGFIFSCRMYSFLYCCLTVASVGSCVTGFYWSVKLVLFLVLVILDLRNQF